jgi:dCMP deaminase
MKTLDKHELEWATYLFNIVKVVRTKSKDPHTQVGCVITGQDHGIRSTGYNSFPRGLDDNVEERKQRPEKYLWIEHAERNAIYNAAKSGIPLDGCAIYMHGLPCTDCARAIIQSGIKKIVYDANEWAKWNSVKYNSELINKSLQMLSECGVEVVGVEL